MRRLFIFVSLFLCAINCNADDNLYSYEDNGHYQYKITDATNKYVSLMSYSNDNEGISLTIPSKVTNEDGESYTVNELSLINSSASRSLIPEDCKINDIFIPSSIIRIYRVINNCKTLKYIIIENGDKIFFKNDHPFNFTETIFPIDYFIIFNNSEKEFKNSSLVGTVHKDEICQNKIIITYKDGTSETVNMYLHYVKNELYTIDNTTFNYLISALQRRGTDLSTISEINLKEKSPIFIFNFASNPANVLSFGAKVITTDQTYVSSTIFDKVNFSAPTTEYTGEITYSRQNTKDWNSVCLPFDIQESDFGEGNKIYTLTSVTDNTISLSRIADGEVVPAGTPCFIHSTDDEWSLTLEKTISSDVTAKTIVTDGMKLIGSFTKETIGIGKYKLNSAGSYFGTTTSDAATVVPFRCYIETTGQNAPSRLNVNLDEEASITLIPDDAAAQKVKLYDLMGRPRKEGTPGLFIKSTR